MTSLNLYFDDTGSRHPDKKADKGREGKDWFALGGFLINQEDETTARKLHAEVVSKWKVRSPFHITDMMACQKNFSWLGRKEDVEQDKFWSDYKSMLARVPVIGLACVIDRPGYVARGYLDTYPDRWLLCRSAFDILIERSVKFAKMYERKLKVVFEGDPGVNKTFKGYFQNLRARLNIP